jgi:hypothetical protein
VPANRCIILKFALTCIITGIIDHAETTDWIGIVHYQRCAVLLPVGDIAEEVLTVSGYRACAQL